METLRFTYCNADGEISQRELTEWEEVGHYIKGFSVGNSAVRTFRKDRVIEYFDGGASLLSSPNGSPPPRISKEKPANQQPQILFTGFASALRAELEEKASTGGLQVCKTVTKELAYLCIGANAGPSKVEKARAQHVYILDQAQLHLLIETGELVDIHT
jgi:NAD-dependent DNA ligase